MTRIKKYLLTLAVVLGLVVAATPAPVSAINVFKTACKNNGSTEVCQAKGDSINPIVEALVNTLLFAIGTIAVVMIIIGGIRYATSNGDSGRITSAKNTIMYSVVGLVVALMAFAIVKFVVAQFG